jgi:predicted ester cyclase
MNGAALPHSPVEIVRAFFATVRSGLHPDAADRYMADQVLAHQVVADESRSIQRTPQDYADHVREMRATFGDFGIEITECLAEGDRVYIRWRQSGTHVGVIDGFEPTGLPLVEVASAVYRIDQGRIVEYWIQIDRAGIRQQLERNAQSRAH